MKKITFSLTNSETDIAQPILYGEETVDHIPLPTKTFIGDADKPLDEQAYEIYTEVLRYTGIARIWNYIPNINAMHDEITDSYMLFNMGRHKAWDAFGPKKEGKPYCPAATAIGAVSGPLRVDILLSENRLIHYGNTRQTRFVDYTEEYGAKPPCSSRITVQEMATGWKLWVAGTSAVVGQKTEGRNLYTQCQATWENLQALLLGNEKLKALGIKDFDIYQPQYLRAYLRDPNQLREYRTWLSEFFKTDPIIHQADICRGIFTGLLYHEVECLYVIKK